MGGDLKVIPVHKGRVTHRLPGLGERPSPEVLHRFTPSVRSPEVITFRDHRSPIAIYR